MFCHRLFTWRIKTPTFVVLFYAIVLVLSRGVTGQPSALLKTHQGHLTDVNSLAFSLDGKMLATTGYDSRKKRWYIDLYNAQSLAWRQTRQLPKPTVLARLAPDFKTFAISEAVRRVQTELRTRTYIIHLQLSDMATGRRLWRYERNDITDIAFAPYHDLLAVDESEMGYSSFYLWRKSTGKIIGTALPEAGGNDTSRITFSPNGLKLVALAVDGPESIFVSSFPHHKMLWKKDTKDPSVWAVDAIFSPDSKVLASSHNDGAVRLWDARTGSLLHSLETHSASAPAIAFLPDNSSLAAGNSDGLVTLWNTHTGKPLRTIQTSRNLQLISVSPDGKTLATSTKNGTIALWRIK